MALVLTVLLAVVLAGVCYWRQDWGVIALVAALPFERIGAWALHPATGHPVVRLSQIIAAALVAGFAGRVISRRQRLRRPSRPLWLLGAFLGSATVSACIIGQRSLWNGLLALGLLTAVCWVLDQLGPQLPWRRLGWALAASAAVVGSFGLYQFVAGSLGAPGAWTGLRLAYERQIFGFPRIQSTALEPLYFANYLLLPLSMGLAWLFARRPLFRRRWLAAGVTGLGLVFGLTMSRGAFVGLAVAVIPVAAWGLTRRGVRQRLRRWWRRLALGSFALMLAIFAFVALASYKSTGSFTTGPQQFAELISTKLTTSASYTERAQMRNTALTIFYQHPVMGVGIEGITPYLRGYDRQRSQNDIIALNNQFLELLAETGAVGAGLFYAFLLALGLSAWRAWPLAAPEVRPWLAGLVLALLSMTIQAQSFSGFLLTHFWVAYGLLAAAVGAARQNQQNRA